MVVLWPELDRDRPIVLSPQGATTACADTNGDGVGGLVRLMVRLVDVDSRDEIIAIVTPSDGVDITDVGAATFELVGANLRVVVDGEVHWRVNPPTGTRTRF